MRQVSRTAGLLTIVFASGLWAVPAIAEDIYYLNQSQSGFNLPGVSLPQGQDEVRAADGTTCRSAVGGNGAYLDVGAINGSSRRDGEIATYGRVVIPLGRGGKRLNCAELYELEVARLRAELKLLQMGLSGTSQVANLNGGGKRNSAGDDHWTNTGWADGPATDAP
ncbi:hypothetical protein [Aureimonas sp. ME7]|uniref:hypothetical protein n=1 Tax=Aureimonas sp. ME7 TaxID=2744252 RepID=UPI001FCE4098|nr:hypothetical protein [Aureimonas sp. ME7]